MSRRLIVFVLTIGLSSCASGNPGPGGSEEVGRGGLTVLNYRETYQPTESYLAKFEIVGGSAALLFPARERDIEPTGPGTHRLPGLVPAFVKAQRDLYSPRATGLLNEAPRRIVEVTVLVITSEQPLDLSPFLDSPSALRNLLLEAGATNEQEVVAEILETAIPNPDAVVWASDIRSVRIPESWAGGGRPSIRPEGAPQFTRSLPAILHGTTGPAAEGTPPGGRPPRPRD